MALFTYRAFTKEGKTIQGTVDASSEDRARDQLVKRGLYPVSIESTREEAVLGWRRFLQFFSRGVSVKEKILFTKQLAVLLKSGVPLLQALELLIDQFEGSMRTILIDLKDGIKEGQSLAEGLARYPKVFENIYVQLVRAGEATGKLEIILERLIDYIERREAIVKKIKSAMRYPLIQLSVVVIVVIVLLTSVLPNLAEVFSSQKVPLPGTTRFLLGMSALLTSYWYLLLSFLIIAILAFRYWKKTSTGARQYDQVKLKIPIVGYFARMGAVVQFSRTLGMLVESGVNLAESLDIVVSIVDNRILADALYEARDNIIKQGRIAEFLKQTNIFPPIAIYLINTGEQSGQLDTMLLTVAKNYEDDLTEYSDALSSLLEPIMMIVMAVVVGFVVLSVVQPIVNQTQLLNL